MTLAETQQTVKKLILVAIIMTFLYYSGKFALTMGKKAFLAFFPPEPEPAAQIFGKLPKLSFQKIEIQGNPQYVLDTASGRLPDLPDRSYVYKINQPKPNLLSEQKIKKIAQDLGFSGDFTKLSPSQLKWVDGTTNRIFDANVVTQNFSLEIDNNRLSSVAANLPTITASDSKESVTNFLKSKSLIDQTDKDYAEFITVPTQVTLGQIKEAKLTPNQAKLMFVGMKRSVDIVNKFPILGTNPKMPYVNFLVTNDRDKYKYPQIHFVYWSINYDQKSDYNLSPIKSVWDAVKNNQGVVTYLKPKDTDFYAQSVPTSINTIEIRNIYLAYYEPKELETYLQPIYVFEGQYKSAAEIGDIVIYYPAVRGDLVN